MPEKIKETITDFSNDFGKWLDNLLKESNTPA